MKLSSDRSRFTANVVRDFWAMQLMERNAERESMLMARKTGTFAFLRLKLTAIRVFAHSFLL